MFYYLHGSHRELGYNNSNSLFYQLFKIIHRVIQIPLFYDFNGLPVEDLFALRFNAAFQPEKVEQTLHARVHLVSMTVEYINGLVEHYREGCAVEGVAHKRIAVVNQ